MGEQLTKIKSQIMKKDSIKIEEESVEENEVRNHQTPLGDFS